MAHDEELRQYRESLVQQLQSQQQLCAEAVPDVFRIFVNHRCVGSMDCEEGRASFTAGFEGQEVTLLEVRTDSGLLVGSVTGAGPGEHTGRVRIGGRHRLILSLSNHGERGTVKVSYQPVRATVLAFLADVLAWMADRAGQARQAFSELSWAMRMSLALQAVLAIGFVFLLLNSNRDALQEEAQVLESRLIASANQQIARMNQEITALAKDQQAMREQLASYEKSQARSAIEIEHRVERRLLPELQKATLEMVQIRQQIQELASAKESLKQDLAAAMKQQAETLAKMKLPPSPEGPQSFRATASPPLAQADDPPKVAGGARPEEMRPLTFWVSFHEGTTEKHVQDLLHQIHGRKIKGPTSTGWINVEAHLKQSETIEGFFETVKKSKIVSAITTSLSGQ